MKFLGSKVFLLKRREIFQRAV